MQKRELLQVARPDLVPEWDEERNSGISIATVRDNSALKVWWKCPRDCRHIYQARVRNRAIEGNGCPFCSGRRTLREDSFAALHPTLAQELHPTKNGAFDPFTVSPGTNRVVHWKCSNGHEWRGQIGARVRDGTSCRKCSYVKGRPTLADHALATELHPTKNGGLTAGLLTLSTRQRVWWRCGRVGTHEWQESVAYRIKSGNGCPICKKPGGPQPTLSEFSESLSAEWHAELNGDHTPKDFTIGSGYLAWWRCSKNAAHKPWKAAIRNRTKNQHGCPQCARCAFDPEKSLARRFPTLAAEWHPTKNAPLTPVDVTIGSARRVWWRCSKDPTHEWPTSINDRTRNPQRGCPHCSKHRLTAEKSLAVLFPLVSAEWHPSRNLPLTPETVFGKSAKKVWWQCRINPSHEWKAQIKNRTILGTGCSECAKEKNVIQILRDLAESSYSTTDTFETLLLSIRNLERLAVKAPANASIRGLYHRMLFAQTITILEGYLADAFLGLVLKNKVFKQRLLTEVNEFKDRKFSYAEILEMNLTGDSAIAEALSEILWHNLAKAKALYATVLGVGFEGDLSPLFRAVVIRHDIVHRNGRNRDGRMTPIGQKEVTDLIKAVKNFARTLDAKLTRLSDSQV